MFAEHMGDQFDRCKHSLQAGACAIVAGLIFICLADDPPADFDVMRAAMEPYLLPHGSDELQGRGLDRHHRRGQLEAHDGEQSRVLSLRREPSGADHSRSTTMASASRTPARREKAMAALSTATGGSAARAMGSDEACRRRRSTGSPISSPVFARNVCRSTAAANRRRSTRMLASKKLLGGFEQADLGGLSFWTQPNSWHHFMSDHIVTFSVIPLAPNTLVRTKWLVHKDAREGIDYDVKTSPASGARPTSRMPRWSRSRSPGHEQAYEPGPYSPFTEGSSRNSASGISAASPTGWPERNG